MGLTIDPSLLKQLAQDQKQNAAASGGAMPSASRSVVSAPVTPSERWEVPKWSGDFVLDEALQMAYGKAVKHINGLLEKDDLYVDLESQEAEVIGAVKEMNAERVVKTYTGLDMLKLYVHNTQNRGVIVDGAL